MTQNEIFTPEEFRKLKPSIRGSKPKNEEEKIQIRVCEYIKNRYPHVIFTCDLASGMRLPIWLAGRHKKMRSSRGLPDLLIAHPKDTRMCPAHGSAKIYHGLFIELKTKSCRLKNGGIKKTEHHEEQLAILTRLNNLGYQAHFACGYDEAVDIISDYMDSIV